MHEHNVVHRDLTSYNILLDFGRPWQVKVSFFIVVLYCILVLGGQPEGSVHRP